MKRFRDWVNSNCDVDRRMQVLRDKMSSLCARVDDVRDELKHAEIQPGNKQRAEVCNWLTNVEGKIAHLQSIEKEGQQQGFDVRLIQIMTEEVEELIQQGRFPNGLVLYDHERTRFPLIVHNPVGEMFQINTEKIIGWFKNPQQFMFGVYGMGGVGKTTLLKHIHNLLLEDSSTYGRVYWITVSQNCNRNKLQDEIAKVAGLDLSERQDEIHRAAALRNALAKLGKMVVILDDMWEDFNLEDIGIPLGEHSCKIILTTRTLEVCRRMGCHKFVVEVKSLSESEAWNLFVDQIPNYGELTTEVKQLAKSVAKECGCLPLAVITIGGCMIGIDSMHEWQNALDELRNPSRGQSNMENEVLSKLKFSYDHLGNDRLKMCFLSCLCAEDEIRERGELIDQWIMEGLLDDIGSRKEQLSKGHTILNKLLQSCLLERVSYWEQHVKMHDLIRDLGIFITREHPKFIAKPRLRLKQVPEEKHWTEDLVKVSLEWNEIEEIPCDMSPRCSNLSVLNLRDNPLKAIPESFFVHMRALTVLDLSDTYIERVPDSLSNLENLRALLLEQCWRLRYVPSLAKLTKLKVLDLDRVELIEVPRGMERLECLEEIQIDKWNISDLTYFNRLIENWRIFTLHCYDFWLLRVESLEFADYAAHFDIRGYDRKITISGVEVGPEEPTPVLPRTIQALFIGELDIKGRKSLRDVFPSLDGATDLKALEVQMCSGLECILLVSVCSSQPPRSAVTFAHLKELHVSGCPNIKVVFRFQSLQQQTTHFPNLEQISVWECDELEEIFEAPNSSSFQTVYGTNYILFLPKLRVLDLRNLPKLSNIYRGRLLCPSLEKFTTHCCPKLANEPSTEPRICDASPSTMSSIPTNDYNYNYTEDARLPSHICDASSLTMSSIPTDDYNYNQDDALLLSPCLDIFQRPGASFPLSGLEDDLRSQASREQSRMETTSLRKKWGASLSLSLQEFRDGLETE